MDFDPIPPLRDDLEVQRRRDGTVEIRDPHLIQILTVDQRDWAIANAFDGERILSEIIDTLPPTVTRGRVQEIAEQFERLSLLDTVEVWDRTPEPGALAPWGQLGAKKTLKILPEADREAYWSCHGCGSCCHGLQVELTDEEEGRIDASLYADLLNDDDYAESVFLETDAPAKRVLRQRPEAGDACIFLAEDGRCWIHARQGMEAKPDACQIFPLMVVRVPREKAPRLGVRINCESMFLSYDVEAKPLSQLAAHAHRLSGPETHAAPGRVLWFGKKIGFKIFDQRCRQIAETLQNAGLTPKVVRWVDRVHLNKRVAKSRRAYGEGLRAYARDELEGDVAVGSGAYFDQLERLLNGRGALDAMALGTKPPKLGEVNADFLARQVQHVLYLCGPLNAPDAGFGMVALFLAVEATMHAVGVDGTLDEANVALDVFTIPLLETLEHMWPVLDAMDLGYADSLRKEMV